MYKFALYQHDWKEPFDATVVNSYFKVMGGNIEITELEIRGDSFDYCIHTAEATEYDIQKIVDNWYRFENHEWVLKRTDKGNSILILKDEEEIEYLLDLGW